MSASAAACAPMFPGIGKAVGELPVGSQVLVAEAEWQRLKRSEWHLRQILRAVRLKSVHERIEQARHWYGKAVIP